MSSTLITLAGWLPAVIIPAATVIQLVSIFRNRSTQGVSWLTWLLFGIANVGLYIYTEKYSAVQSLLGLLGSALLDFAIAALVLTHYGNRQKEDPLPKE